PIHIGIYIQFVYDFKGMVRFFMAGKRQIVHFTPQKGWINDPNGLIYVDGEFHMFYQHYPYDTKWGPMHWGHAISRDLLTWEHLPVALYPKENEYIFSGSAIIDRENIMGFGNGEKAPMLLFYTSHNPKTGEQMQSMAYSTDYVHFEKYKGNPIIKNLIGKADYKKDFRDPKVFCDAVRGGFGMVLAAGCAVEFYHSDNLTEWTFTGAFYPKEHGYGGLCECPDLFPLEVNGETKYILSMSMILTEEGASEETHIMQYFVGRFDGYVFENEQPFDKGQLLDFGKDNYAMVSFTDSPHPLMLGWGEDWNAARRNEETEFFGKMTLAREIELCEINGKYVIKQIPVCPMSDMEACEVGERNLTLKEGERIVVNGIIEFKNAGEAFFINQEKIQRRLSGNCKIRVFYDNGYCEVFADDGMIVYSCNVS
ncbi:MAG: glycoside hydrolase family 32 protein, partial [Lachnospiraceae bacterium]|nr:glycoside hydrolase family 32 protein [Lachnospiraceae bacterium]